MKSTPSTIAGLYNEEPIVRPVPEKVLRILGWDKTVFIQQVHYLISENSRRAVSFADNEGQMRYWICKTYAQWKEELFSPSERIVRHMIKDLEKDGIILSKEGKSRIKYYTIDYKKLSSLFGKQKTSECRKTYDMSAEKRMSYNNKESIERESIEEEVREYNASLSSVPHPQEDAPLTQRIQKNIKEKIRGTRISKDWSLNDEQKQRSINAGMLVKDLEDEIFGFRSFWLNCTGKNAVKIDWWLAWQDHVRRYCSFKGIKTDYTCFGSTLLSEHTSDTNIPKRDLSPPPIPESERLVSRFKEELIKLGGEWEQLWDNDLFDSDMKITASGGGKAEVWVNTSLQDALLSIWEPNYALKIVLNEIDPAMIVPPKELDPKFNDHWSVEIKRRAK